MEHRETVFAAWIINISRFYKEGPIRLVEKCSSILQHYMNVADILGILEGKEEYKEEKNIVEEAFRLSMCESEIREKTAKGKNLTSVFSRVSVKDGVSYPKRYYSLTKEQPGAMFPSDHADEESLDRLAEEFLQELMELNHCIPKTWEDFILIYDTIVRKYMWCITASDYEGEDISLYNQSRIAAAIASCISRCRNTDRKCYKLVVGDFSGIQKYVFAAASVNEAGVAKRLRARSFYVDMAVSMIAQDMIRQFQVTQNHILMLTGGKFYLLLPNIPESEELLSKIESQVGDNFYHLFKGQIAIHLAWLTMGAEGLEYYSKSVTEIMRNLAEKKNQAFYSSLVSRNQWNEEEFVLYQDLSGKKLCTSCGGELTEKQSARCRNCEMQTRIGEKIPRTRFIAYYRGEKPGTFHVYGDYWIGLWDKLKRDDAFLIEQINGESNLAVSGNLPIRIRYMANHIPTDEKGDVMTFQKIAEVSRGTKKLAVLKADVDNLGYIFADGLRIGNRHLGTISRVNTMSRLLEIFFSGRVNELISGEKEYQCVYSVFSGGDDLFLIGPWDVMPRLAVRVAEEFREFAAGNPSLTLSAAVSVFSPGEHIANLAELSEKTLKRVKNTTVPAMYPEKQGRNGVCFLGEMFSWEDLKSQTEISLKLAALLKEKKIGTSALRRIGIYSRMYREFLIKKDVMGLMFEPLFFYDRQRNYGDLEKKKRDCPELTWFLDEYAADLSKNIADLRNVKRNLFFAETATAYAMNLSKEERG